MTWFFIYFFQMSSHENYMIGRTIACLKSTFYNLLHDCWKYYSLISSLYSYSFHTTQIIIINICSHSLFLYEKQASYHGSFHTPIRKHHVTFCQSAARRDQPIRTTCWTFVRACVPASPGGHWMASVVSWNICNTPEVWKVISGIYSFLTHNLTA